MAEQQAFDAEMAEEDERRIAGRQRTVEVAVAAVAMGFKQRIEFPCDFVGRLAHAAFAHSFRLGQRSRGRTVRPPSNPAAASPREPARCRGSRGRRMAG
jgi:hypothetical protein